MMLDVYVGRLDDPYFVANKDSPGGAVPYAESPLFPHGSWAFHELIGRIARGVWQGGATEHIGYVSPASLVTVLSFLDEICEENATCASANDREAEEALRRWLADRDDDGQWCLVASED